MMKLLVINVTLHMPQQNNILSDTILTHVTLNTIIRVVVRHMIRIMVVPTCKVTTTKDIRWNHGGV
jgi:hypothetical protein